MNRKRKSSITKTLEKIRKEVTKRRKIENEQQQNKPHYRAKSDVPASKLEEKCGCCEKKLKDLCVMCDAVCDANDRCVVALGVCGHAYHFHCLIARSNWMARKNPEKTFSCPHDECEDLPWKLDAEKCKHFPPL